MGTSIVDAPQQSAEMAAAKPARERQFQVVPMPGVFTRGRWKCWDYRERDDSQNEKKEQILEFEKEKGDATVPEVCLPAAVSSSESALDSVSNYSISNSEISASESTPVKEKESSSTIVVTSIAPAPPTPQHGTPQNQSDDIDRSGHGLQTSFSSQLSHSQADLSMTATTQAVTGNITSLSNEPHMQQHASVATMVTSSSQPQQQLNIVPPPQSAPQSLRPPVTPNNEAQPSEEESSTAANPAAVTPNVAAIDNKIEQAMDLVKTHLTFAVREEVEVLRQTIADLEQKVASLESENQLLRQYAPGEVVSNLPALAQQHKAAAAPVQSAAGLPALPPPKVPAGFCSSTFATTLNNVVADVRQELSAVSASALAQSPQHQ